MTPLRLGGLFAFICAVAYWQLGAIGQSGIQMAVGPAAVPTGVVALFALMVALYIVSAARGQEVDESAEPDQSALPGSGVRLISLFGGGVLFIAGVGVLGFVLPATACGMCVARSFDAPFNAKSMLICATISVTLWALFAKLLGVGLGPATPFGF
jgi:hypothetical protein